MVEHVESQNFFAEYFFAKPPAGEWVHTRFKVVIMEKNDSKKVLRHYSSICQLIRITTSKGRSVCHFQSWLS
jgi:hypothetical protein